MVVDFRHVGDIGYFRTVTVNVGGRYRSKCDKVCADTCVKPLFIEAFMAAGRKCIAIEVH